MSIKEVKTQGYTLLKQAHDPTHLLARIKALEPYVGEDVPYLNQGSDMIYCLQNKDFVFVEAALRNKQVNEILGELLNDPWYKNVSPNYILRSMIARSGGEKALPLHIDSFIPSSGKYCWSAQVMFVLEDMDESNGCTKVLPFSHLWDRYAHPDSEVNVIPIIAKAGDILIIDSRLHHGASRNTSNKSRWLFTCTFTRWFIKQNYKITDTLPARFYSKLTDQERAIMGYCSMPPINETDRIDIKGGYNVLPN